MPSRELCAAVVDANNKEALHPVFPLLFLFFPVSPFVMYAYATPELVGLLNSRSVHKMWLVDTLFQNF